jgi:hypothetical protein
MALTRREFERQLQPLLDGWIVEVLCDVWYLRQNGRLIEISCRPLPTRRLGLLEMPSLAVDISFDGCDKQDEAQFLQRFHRYFQRGGG